MCKIAGEFDCKTVQFSGSSLPTFSGSTAAEMTDDVSSGLSNCAHSLSHRWRNIDYSRRSRATSSSVFSAVVE